MPLYLYKCNQCGEEFEVIQSINADAFTKHSQAVHEAKCDGEIFRKITRGTNVILKGTGFYETDYVRKSSDSVKSE